MLTENKIVGVTSGVVVSKAAAQDKALWLQNEKDIQLLLLCII